MLKDTWVDNERMRDGDILASLHAAANGEDRELVEKHFLTTVSHGDVWTEDDVLDDTANCLMGGLKITPYHNSQFTLQRKTFFESFRYSHLRCTQKTHYRIVFKEKGTTIDCVTSLHEVMTVLSETAGGAF